MADETIETKLDATLDKATKETPANLKDVIKDAIKQSNVTLEVTKEDKVETRDIITNKVEQKIEDKKEELGDDLNQQQLDFAKTLYKALNNPDPTVQLRTLELLATAAGKKIGDVETKQEVKQEIKDIKTLLKEGLGEFDFLAEKLGPVLETVLNRLVEDKTKDIREDNANSKAERARSEVATAVDSAFAEFSNAVEVKDEVIRLMDEIKPTAKMSHKSYFNSLIRLAASNKNVTLKPNSEKQVITDKKIEKNRNDAGSRLASERGAEVKDIVRTTQFKNVKEAVRDAAEKAAELMAGKK